ncbi:MAG: hypothetical protein A2X84_09065 [Desulfuromonadaceae bacterium GWC2_58_13]|nr:MAG: hypothetical protein A2X84_09065 [Desulfuromonadaceae bacterium GWC2_58_13]
MVPLSVSNAWEKLQESKKVAICRSCARKQAPIFARWIEAAGLKNFRQDSLVNRKAGSASRLDAVLFKAEGGQLARDLLVSYFTEQSPAINDQCLEMLEGAGKTEEETKLKIYAQISHLHRDSPFIGLYLATALWVEKFNEDDINTVEALAAGLSSTEEQ